MITLPPGITFDALLSEVCGIFVYIVPVWLLVAAFYGTRAILRRWRP